MSVDIYVDTSDYDTKISTVRTAIEEFIPRMIQDGTAIIQQEMANQVPVKTGNLRASISSDISHDESTTGTNTGYGRFVDQPTAPHFIRPTIGKFLHFRIDGQDVYAREVFHPGTKGAFFIQGTMNAVVGPLKELGKAIWSELVTR